MTPSKPYVVGLTGDIACGKSNVSQALRDYGAEVIDADEISRALTAPGGAALPLIRERFGDAVFDNGILNRQALAGMVFARPELLATLNSMMHPLVFREMARQQALSRALALMVDVPLLYETGYDQSCDEVWCVWAPSEEQLQRLLNRGLSSQEAIARIDSQMPALEKARRADQVLITTGSKQESAQAAVRLWEELLRRLGSG
jgi:dephospho-CoA kinase